MMQARNIPSPLLDDAVATGDNPVEVVTAALVGERVYVAVLVRASGGGEMVVAAPLTLVTVGIIVVALPDASTVTHGLGAPCATSRCSTICTSVGRADAGPASSKLAAARSCPNRLLLAIVALNVRQRLFPKDVRVTST